LVVVEAPADRCSLLPSAALLDPQIPNGPLELLSGPELTVISLSSGSEEMKVDMDSIYDVAIPR